MEVLTIVSGLLYSSLVLVVSLYCWYRWRYRYILRVASKLPCTSRAWPLIGDLHAVLWGLENLTTYILEESRIAVAQGLHTGCFWIGPLPYLVVHDIDDIRAVMASSKTIDKAQEYDYMVMGLDTGAGPIRHGLLTAPGPVWKPSRKVINTVFRPHNLNLMMPVYNKHSRYLVNRLSTEVGKGPTKVNMTEYLNDAAYMTINDFIFGFDINTDVDPEKFREFLNIEERITLLFMDRIFKPWLRWKPLFQALKKKEITDISNVIKTFLGNALMKAENHAELKQKKSMENENDYEYSKNEFMSFPEVYRPFLERNPEFTEADMRGEIVTLFATGTDTVVNQASYFLMAMGQYPEYQDKLYEEITSVVGPDDDVTTDHVRQMIYLDQCFQETLRSFTLVPLTIRKTSEEIKLSDCTVPANQNIVLSLYGVHMNPKIFPNPERFDPERYSPENVASRGKHVNVAFSGGPRDCIGKQYASLLVKVLVVQILRKYKVTPVVDVHKLRVMLTIVITSMEGYFVEMTPRH